MVISALKKIVRRLLTPVYYFTSSREAGVTAELAFWEQWLQTRGSSWPEAYRIRLDPCAPLEPWHEFLLSLLPDTALSILDVGAGPLSSIGKYHAGKELLLTAVDPLADQYNFLLDKYAIVPPVATRSCAGEHLLDAFPKGSFHWVHAQNSLDHAVDPLLIIRNMIVVCRKGGVVSLQHKENEGRNEHYRGLHQWNFVLKEGRLHVAGRQYCTCIDDQLHGVLGFQHEMHDGFIRSWGIKA